MASASRKEEKGNRSKTDKRSKEASFDMDELRELADLVDERGFTDFEFENEKIRVRLSKSAPVQPLQPYTDTARDASAPARAPVAIPAEEPVAEEDDGLYKITSPIVGTFYRAPSPDKAPYVKEGDTVSGDSVVCIVEAMKLMNEIQAEVAGQIAKVYVENGQAVEFGQPLFGIRK